MDKSAKIYIAGAQGMVGSAIKRVLQNDGYSNIIGPHESELDLMDQNLVHNFFNENKPDYVFVAAAKVGGIHANNTYPAEFIYNNLQIQNNVIDSAYRNNVKKLLFLGSSCIYPKFAKQPMSENELLSGKLEPTNEPYAIAKIAGIIMCQSYNRQYGTNFICVMPTNLYGINDNYHPENSHVIPALIRRFHEAKVNKKDHVVIWGTGEPKREFLYTDDLADACIYLMKNYDSNEIINIGSGIEVTIKEVSELVKKVIGFEGVLEFDTSKPDGTPRKLLDLRRLHGTGWHHKVDLERGLKLTYKDYIKKA
jgi:GDP-L-fucose synthase